MTGQTVFVFLLIAAAGILMASNRVRFDVVAILTVIALSLSGVLTVEEAIAGFGSPVVALVAGLLVLGEMLSRTGVARVMGDWVMKQGGNSEVKLLMLIMGAAGLLGSVMSSTVVVALFIPVVTRIAAQTQLNSARMLIPLSYASLISGMLTLIATTPNIVIHEALRKAGYDGFGFFSFTPVGIAVLVVCIAYIVLIGRHLLGAQKNPHSQQQIGRSVEELWLDHSPGSTYRKLRIAPSSPLLNMSIGETQLESKYTVRIIGILKENRTRKQRVVSPVSSYELSLGTTMVVVGKARDIDRLQTENDLVVVPHTWNDQQRWLWDISAATVLIHPDSQLLGKSLRECEFRTNYGVHVLGLRRNFHPVENFEDTSLQPADSLFLVGSWNKIQQLTQKPHDFVVTEFPNEHKDVVPSYHRMRTALIILGLMVLLTMFNIVPLIPAVMLASLAAIFTRCLTMEDAYRSISWSSLVLLAGMLPLAEALNKTGGTQLLADGLMSLTASSGPYLLMSVLFFLTASIGLVLSNTAAAVLVSPIAIYAASAAGWSPLPFAVAVLIASSSSFSTPVATPVVTLVVEPGRYTFFDFVKVGLPLLFLTYVTTLLITPLLFPFTP